MIRAKTESPADVVRWMESEAASLFPAMLGSLSFRRSPCGHKNCSACLSGEQHRSHVLYGRHNDRRFAVYVPGELVGEVRRSIENGRALQDLLMQAGPQLLPQFEQLNAGDDGTLWTTCRCCRMEPSFGASEPSPIVLRQHDPRSLVERIDTAGDRLGRVGCGKMNSESADALHGQPLGGPDLQCRWFLGRHETQVSAPSEKVPLPGGLRETSARCCAAGSVNLGPESGGGTTAEQNYFGLPQRGRNSRKRQQANGCRRQAGRPLEPVGTCKTLSMR
jgi:hypothetical protein